MNVPRLVVQYVDDTPHLSAGDELINLSDLCPECQKNLQAVVNTVSIQHDAVLTGYTFTKLTKRELEVAELTALGMCPGDIAEKLVRSNDTVRKHIQNIFEKLQVNRSRNINKRLILYKAYLAAGKVIIPVRKRRKKSGETL